MKHIGIDARLYYKTGVGTYIRNLLHYLNMNHQDKNITYHLFVLPGNHFDIKRVYPQFMVHSVNALWHSFNEQTRFLITLTNLKLDVMHFTYFGYPTFYTRPFITTVHDLTPLLFKTGKASTKNPLVYSAKFQLFKFVLQRQIQNAKHIITPTKTVKKTILEHFTSADPFKITTTYEGLDYEFPYVKPNNQLLNQFKRPFFLYVGNFYPHKNVENLIRAFKRVHTSYDLVLAGSQDFFHTKVKQRIIALSLQDRIHLYPNPTRADLKCMYTMCRALIHPSLSEGFGLPLVEAMSNNVPIIASNIGVFNELLSDQALYFDPHNQASITYAINSFINDPFKVDYNEWIERFSFKSMAAKTFELYEKIVFRKG